MRRAAICCCAAPANAIAGRQRATWHSTTSLAFSVALSVFLAVGAGCRQQRRELPRSQAVSSDHSAADTAVDASTAESKLTVTDRLDRRVSFAAPPQRIVSLTPAMTEVLFAIGAGDRVVGVTQYCDYPPRAKDLPRVGRGTLESLNQEKIVAMRPDLVLCKWDNHVPLVNTLDRLGIPALALGPETLAELYTQTELLGQIVGNVEQAESLVESMGKRVDAVAQRVPSGERPTVFYQVWDNPLMTAGPNSFIGELLNLAGGRNLFGETPIRYPKVSPEVVVAGDPDVILAPSTHDTAVSPESILQRPGWGQVSAIRDKRVHLIDGDKVSRCGPRLVDALEEIASVLHPQQFLLPSETAASEDAVDDGRILQGGTP